MQNDKLFDCVFVTVDSQNRRTVRFANDLQKRLQVFKRDNITVLFQAESQTKLNKLQLCELALNDVNLDVNDEELVEKTILKIKNKDVSHTDILDVIRERGKQQNASDLVVA